MRSSCPRCGCEIVTLDRSHNYVTELNRVWEKVEWSGRGRVDLEDGCRCHEVALRFLTNPYE